MHSLASPKHGTTQGAWAQNLKSLVAGNSCSARVRLATNYPTTFAETQQTVDQERDHNTNEGEYEKMDSRASW
ncbi:MAG: hypothetical protein EA428_00950 [Spirochaetaceae bacterium]|nr:MAG: hypothetical protein EA428_00950 [Spirochaetaceae bacterium]